MSASGGPDAGRPKLSRVEIVVNPRSGSTGPDAPDQARRILSELGVAGEVRTPGDDDLMTALRQAMDAGPDLLAVVAGDGTARCAAELAGPDGPLVAPLPGGTMNMLPRRLYGERKWDEALRAILTDGVERSISGGSVDGRTFFVAAIIGAPAHWADAREAMREGKAWLAFQRARRAVKRAFRGQLRFTLDGGPPAKAEALTLMCPLVSRIMETDDRALEATAVDPKSAAEAFRLGMRGIVGDWRSDASVAVGRCRKGAIMANGRIPALLDGEPIRLDRRAEILFVPDAFRALIPKDVEL